MCDVVETYKGKEITHKAWADEAGGFQCYHVPGTFRHFHSISEARQYIDTERKEKEGK